MTTLSERLTDAMKEAGVTAADLARATGAKAPSIHKWVHGTTKNLRGKNLVIAAQLLNVSESWLADGVGPRRRTSGRWPFSASFEAYDSLDEDKKMALDDLVSAFLAGAAPNKSSRKKAA